MARPLRIQFPGAHYHVMNRGEKGNNIFLFDNDRQRFLSLLAAAVDMFRIKVFAFSLMDNHYHLLFQTMEANLSKVMHYMGGVYTQKLNRKYNWDGHLFRGRYKAILIDRDNYLLEAIRYIHLNPVRAGIVKTPEEHLWTSYRSYVASSSQPPWLHIEEILPLFGKDARKARQAFDDFTKRGIPERIMKFYSQKRVPAVLGSEDFVEDVRERYIQRHMDDYELPEAKRIKKIPLRQLAELIAGEYRLNVDDIKEGKRRVRNQPRRLAIHIARRYAGYSLREIGGFFKIGSYTGVSTIVRQVQEEVDTNKKEKAKLRLLVEKLRLAGE